MGTLFTIFHNDDTGSTRVELYQQLSPQIYAHRGEGPESADRNVPSITEWSEILAFKTVNSKLPLSWLVFWWFICAIHLICQYFSWSWKPESSQRWFNVCCAQWWHMAQYKLGRNAGFFPGNQEQVNSYRLSLQVAMISTSHSLFKKRAFKTKLRQITVPPLSSE